MLKYKGKTMDNVGKNNIIYQEIFASACSVFLVLIQLYIVFISKGIDILGFNQIRNTILKILISSLCQILFLGFIYLLIYRIVYTIKSFLWINRNKEIWIKGIWLHIHIKKNIRIGYVDIKQNFYSISAKGQNVGFPDTDHIHNFTDWKYYMAQVADDPTARDFIGCYSANKHDITEQNDGIHMLSVEKKSTDGFPTYMRGQFKDTFAVTDYKLEAIDTLDHSGKLLLYKPSKKCLDYLFTEDGFSYDRLSNIINVKDLSSEPFVICLNELLKEFKSNEATT